MFSIPLQSRILVWLNDSRKEEEEETRQRDSAVADVSPTRKKPGDRSIKLRKDSVARTQEQQSEEAKVVTSEG